MVSKPTVFNNQKTIGPSGVMPISDPILFVQTAFLGDLLLSIPSLKRIKKLHPERPLYLVCRKGLASLFVKYKICDQVYEIEKGNKQSYQDILNKFSDMQFYSVICPHESITSAFFVNKIKSKQKWGFKKWWNFLFFNFRVQKNLNLPEAIRQMSLLTVQDQELENLISSLPQDQSLFKIPDWASGQIVPYQGNENWICLFPGSVWPTKMWTKSGFREVANYFGKKNYKIILLGSEQENILCQEIAQDLEFVENLAGKTNLNETLQILVKSKLVLSNDSGGQHLASLCQIPTVSLFGPTVLNQGFRPWNDRIEIAEVKNLSCRPCGKHGHQKCPLGTHECMQSLSSQFVIAKIEKLL